MKELRSPREMNGSDRWRHLYEPVPLPFYITPQQPLSIVSARNKLFDKSDSFKKQNITVKMSKNSLTLPNGDKYSEEVPLLTSADVSQIQACKTQKLDDITIKSVDPVRKNGSEFFAIGSEVDSVESVQDFYKKACIDPYVASVDSRILVYRFRENDKVTENYHDDGEHGAGRRLLKFMQDNQIIYAAFVVTRWMGEHIGPERFTIMENLLNDVANLL
ncbi:protein IMPACT homolog [Saccostrea cucullata]|uniref:protein IMPACT homolog n=1 Tax=Saccostrea cuccullata TaxID=36930 RepID=UPI002ED4251A